MITGTGVDIMEIARIRGAVDRWGERFLTKVFTPEEIAHCSRRLMPHQHFAARFAAKEAVSKALGSGWAGAFRWKDVEIVNDATGRPSVRLHGALAEGTSTSVIHVSLSHSDTHVVATALIEERVP